MEDKKSCVVRDCNHSVAYSFLRFESREVVSEAFYCNSHGENFIEHYKSSFPGSLQDSRPSNLHGRAFDIELLTYDYCSKNGCRLLLRELGSTDFVEIEITRLEAANLGMLLRNSQSGYNSLTHTTCELLNTGDVAVDHVLLQRDYAELRLKTATRSEKVKTQPSNAISIAVVTDAVIYLPSDSLESGSA